MLTEEGDFSIIDAYLRFAAQGEKILAFRSDQYYWRDLGKPGGWSRHTAPGPTWVPQPSFSRLRILTFFLFPLILAVTRIAAVV